MARKFGYLALVLSACAQVFASAPGAISGYIRNTSGTPQMGATVEVFTSAAKLGVVVFTDANGYYSAANLPAGTYQVRVTAASFLPSLRENISLRSGASLIINLTLATLADAIKLMPARRAPGADPDDWHWTLRSSVNRPILRVFDDDNSGVSRSAEESAEHLLKARVAFIAGSEADGFGSAGEVTTAFALEKSLFSMGTFSFNGNIDTSSGDANGVLRASYAHDFGNGSQPKVTVTYRHLASPGMAVQNAAYSAIGVNTTDSFSIAEFIDLDVGGDMDAVQFARRVMAFRPFGGATVHLSPDMVVEYRYATSVPDARAEKGFETAPADLSESGPRMALAGGSPEIERAHHQEVSVSRRFGRNNVQAAYYVDSINNMVLTGAGDPSSYSDNVLPDVYSGTFSYSGGTMSTSGTRIVLERRLTDSLIATVDYSTGGVAALRIPVSRWQDVASNVTSERRHALGAKFAGSLPACHTHFIASYKWTSGASLSPVDEFNASPGQMEPYFSIFMRQPLPAASFIPAKMELLVDVRNLLAQGYVPVLGQDGRTVYLVQSARAVRGGLAFTF